MPTCEFCDKYYKYEKRLSNHKKKSHGERPTQNATPMGGKQTNVASQTQSAYVEKDDFLSHKMHINEVFNSFSETFFSQFSEVKKSIDTLKNDLDSYNEINNINYDQLKEIVISNQNPQHTQSWDVSDLQCPSNSQRLDDPDVQRPSNDSDIWQTPKRSHHQAKQVSWKVPLANKFSILNEDVEISEPIQNSELIVTHISPPKQNHLSAQIPPAPFTKTRVYPNQHPENDRELRRPPPPNQTSTTANTNTANNKNNNNNNKPLVAIIGDSTIKNITSFELRGMLRKQSVRGHQVNVVVKPFLGAMTRTMPLYLDAVLSELKQKPQLVIVHVATNDIRDGKSPEEIKSDYRNVINYINSLDIKVAVSLVTCRNDDWSVFVTPVNQKLIELCIEMGICYSGNTDINTTHLNSSRYHLNKSGSEALSENFSSAILYIYEHSNYIHG